MKFNKSQTQYGKRRRRSGQALVEMAMSLLVLLPIMMGIIEFGWMLKNINQLNNAAREGARAAAVGRTTTDIKARILSMAKPLVTVDASGNFTKGSIALKVSPSANSTYANGVGYPNDLGDLATTPATNDAKGSDLIRVTVTSKNPSLTKFFPYLTNRPIVGEAVMRREF